MDKKFKQWSESLVEVADFFEKIVLSGAKENELQEEIDYIEKLIGNDRDRYIDKTNYKVYWISGCNHSFDPIHGIYNSIVLSNLHSNNKITITFKEFKKRFQLIEKYED